MIKFQCRVDTYAEIPTASGIHHIGKVKIIKALRGASGKGLKESKDAIEACDGGFHTWIMSDDQFGRWVAEQYILNDTCINGTQAIHIAEVSTFHSCMALDFTK